ncbi:hypothetical protein ENSA5_58260 [Enhygromyxa salina]|uniref:Uncharacterized protein n=1 Tax=Enhygromyxa salina TaxID=215803 RepID=A0A2S9XE02_9BACT|nr:hypothetical protein [Enhygromyxa salina]PRP91089.1 hypothetical protein ENSA5_58260 [Enhygromyxa salina]
MSRLLAVTVAATLSLALVGCVGDEDEAGAEAGETGGEADVALGDTPLPACDAAMFIYEQIVAELVLPSPDPAYVAELYRGDPPDISGESPTPGGSALQRWVREVDAGLGRVEAGVLLDDAAIEAALELALSEADPQQVRLALVDLVQTLRLVASLDVRARLAAVSDVLPDPARDPALLQAEWDHAWCTWSGVLSPLAVEADAVAGEGWEAQIVAGFEDGHAGLTGGEQVWAPDEFATKPAKQIIEKSIFGVIARVLLVRAEAARAGADPALAREALGLFTILEDRVRERNTPAVELITTMLGGDPADIDAAQIETELAIAFVKRARKYCDEAVQAGVLGTPDGIKGAWEGIIYTQVVLPVMSDRLADQGFDAEAHLADWDAYLTAIATDDPAAALELSVGLVEWNCALQAALGIETCTSSDDES